MKKLSINIWTLFSETRTVNQKHSQPWRNYERI